MRKILVGAMVAVTVGAGVMPAVAGMAVSDGHCAQVGGEVHYVNPTSHVIVERDHGAGAEFGLAVASTVMSLAYTPFRFVYGVVGAGLGGIGGWATGGDMRTAKGYWHVTTEGHYFIRPDYLDGTERFRFNGAVPAYREHERVEAVATRESAVTGTVATEPGGAPPDDGADDAL